MEKLPSNSSFLPNDPTKVLADMRELISAGMPPRQACESVGLPRSKFASVMREGEEDSEMGINTPASKFYQAVSEGRARFAKKAIDGIVGAGERDWKALAYLLERSSPTDYRADVQESDDSQRVTLINDVVPNDDEPKEVESDHNAIEVEAKGDDDGIPHK